jgi:hypothetical protein
VKNITDTQKSYVYLDHDNGRKLKTQLYDKRDDFTLPTANFPIVNCNIPTAPVYHNVILNNVPSTVLMSIYFRCWCKSYSNKADLRHFYRNSSIVITNCLTVIRCRLFNWQRIFFSFRYRWQGFAWIDYELRTLCLNIIRLCTTLKTKIIFFVCSGVRLVLDYCIWRTMYIHYTLKDRCVCKGSSEYCEPCGKNNESENDRFISHANYRDLAHR